MVKGNLLVGRISDAHLVVCFMLEETSSETHAYSVLWAVANGLPDKGIGKSSCRELVIRQCVEMYVDVPTSRGEHRLQI